MASGNHYQNMEQMCMEPIVFIMPCPNDVMHYNLFAVTVQPACPYRTIRSRPFNLLMQDIREHESKSTWHIRIWIAMNEPIPRASYNIPESHEYGNLLNMIHQALFYGKLV